MATSIVPQHDLEQVSAGHNAVEAFVRIDRIGAIGGLLFLLAASPFVGKLILVVPGVAILMLIGLLSVALARLNHGPVGLYQALMLAAAGHWIVAIGVAVAIPQLWPVMNITVLIPVVLATPHLSDRLLARFVGAATLAACTVTMVGLLNDDRGAVPDLDDELEMLLLVGALVAHVVPSALIIWNNSRMQRQALARLATINDDLERSRQELADSRQRVVTAADVERRRIERDLHDGAQQQLVALGVRLRLLESTLDDDDQLRPDIETLITGADDAIDELRRLAQGIYPPLLESRGIRPALAAAVRRSPMPVVTDMAEVGRLGHDVERALYFAALEALTNATKHAPDSTIALTLTDGDGQLTLTVRDDGPGFDIESAFATSGRGNMSDRLEVVGGRLTIESTPGVGTTVRAVVPDTRADAAADT